MFERISTFIKELVDPDRFGRLRARRSEGRGRRAAVSCRRHRRPGDGSGAGGAGRGAGQAVRDRCPRRAASRRCRGRGGARIGRHGRGDRPDAAAPVGRGTPRHSRRAVVGHSRRRDCSRIRGGSGLGASPSRWVSPRPSARQPASASAARSRVPRPSRGRGSPQQDRTAEVAVLRSDKTRNRIRSSGRPCQPRSPGGWGADWEDRASDLPKEQFHRRGQSWLRRGEIVAEARKSASDPSRPIYGAVTGGWFLHVRRAALVVLGSRFWKPRRVERGVGLFPNSAQSGHDSRIKCQPEQRTFATSGMPTQDAARGAGFI